MIVTQLTRHSSAFFDGAMSQNDEKNNIEELHATVHGYVQGVGFRYFVVQKATALGLRGYARNESNGDVEVLAQGTRPALERLVTLLRHGPASAEVETVQTNWRAPTEHISGFHVRW
jgi:acylphosphatase